MPSSPQPPAPSPPLRVYYGGTFDPVHDGHLAIARAVRDGLNANVALLPAADPPHKASTHADAAQRAAMLDLAIAGEPGLAVDRRELRRAGPSYSVDSLRELRAELGPSQPVAWLVGSDSLAQLQTWHRWRELFEHAHILAVERPGSRIDAGWLERHAPAVLAEISPRERRCDTLAQAPAGGYAVFPLVRQRRESSSDIRRRIAAGEPWRDLVPAAVADYIQRQGLYLNRPGTPPPL